MLSTAIEDVEPTTLGMSGAREEGSRLENQVAGEGRVVTGEEVEEGADWHSSTSWMEAATVEYLRESE